MSRRAAWICALTAWLSSFRLFATPPDPGEHYRISSISNPPGVDPQIGALEVMPDGRLAAAFHRGEVQFYHPETESWSPFAEGLHEPLGILAEPDGSLLVMQRAELTRLTDTDGDGMADRYQTVWDDFGLTGNYHEFAFGPVRGRDGNLIVALNLASSGDTISREIRGSWAEPGLPREGFYNDWKKNRTAAGRMYSRVPWRGCVMRLNPATGQASLFATGFRSPDGIAFDAEGNLLVVDNQGDWRGTSELHVVRDGGFYGHPASLVWREGWDEGDPVKVPMKALEALRTPAAVWFPHNTYANAPGQPAGIPSSPAWGPFAGQILIGDMNFPRLFRVILEETDGVWQGALIPFLDTPALKRGLNRLVFQGDTLWLGRIHLAWAGGEGIGKVVPYGSPPFDPLTIKVTPTGFRLTFTAPLDRSAQDPASWRIERYGYRYHADYGSPETDKTEIQPVEVWLDESRTIATLTLGGMIPGRIYDFDLRALRSALGRSLLNPRLAYTLRKIPEG